MIHEIYIPKMQLKFRIAVEQWPMDVDLPGTAQEIQCWEPQFTKRREGHLNMNQNGGYRG